MQLQHTILTASLPNIRVDVEAARLNLGGRVWNLRVWCAHADVWFDVRAGTLRTVALAALADRLACVGGPDVRSPWRTWVDVEGWIGSVAVDEGALVLSVGTPRFASESMVLGALGPDAGALAGLVAAWQQAALGSAPREIATVVARHGLFAVLDPTEPDHARVLATSARIASALALGLARHRHRLAERVAQWGLELQGRHAVLRVHALRFVAALPALDHDRHGGEVVLLLRETLRRMLADSAVARRDRVTGEWGALPNALEFAARLADSGSRLLPLAWVAGLTRAAVRRLARQFLAGETMAEAGAALQGLWATGRDATLDPLGELVVSEDEADRYTERVLALVDGLGARHGGSDAHGASRPASRNAAGLERAHVSIKVSALCSDFDPDDPDGVWARVGPRLLRVLRHARQHGVGMTLDAEHYPARDLSVAMLRRALATPDLGGWGGVGIVVQAYLRDAPAHVDAVVAFARTRAVRLPVRLVKGAYWDAETTEATAHDHPAPQFLAKAETDALFQALTVRLLEAGDAIHLCVASHNLRDHAFAEAARAELHPAAPPIEHQVLHATYEALATAMHRQGWAVRSYVPVGSLLVGMAYLVRRILENSSQAGVLTQARHGTDVVAGRVSPALALTLEQEPARDGLCQVKFLGGASHRADTPGFFNVAPVRLHLAEHRAAFEAALVADALLVSLQAVPPPRPGRSGPALDIQSPSQPERTLGRLRTCTAGDVDLLIARAQAAAPVWSAVAAPARAAVLVTAAERMRADRHAWAALVLREAGKARGEALGDVDEAIDFLQFYARVAIDRAAGPVALSATGVAPVGVVAVIAPWNFPLAIPTGMVAGALVTGNAVVLKSAEQTPLVAECLVALLRAAGMPDDAIQHAPGDGPSVGAALVAHPGIGGAVFTGSMAVGRRIHAAIGARPHGPWLRRAVTEMGGKNAALVTATADLDEAVSACLRSAFGHAGQKCSALSRVLVDVRVAEPFVARFARAAADLRVGPAERPGVRVNPVITSDDRDRLRTAARRVSDEAAACGGRVVVDRAVVDARGSGALGWQVGPVVAVVSVAEALRPGSLAETELFGPIVHVIPVVGIEEALALVRAGAYSLTGGVFAQSDDEVAAVVAALPAGNCYVNRPLTGARVAVEPFGGYGMSGTGPKAGGPDYLDAFCRSATVPAARPLAAAALSVLAELPGPPEPREVAESAYPAPVASLPHARALQRALATLPVCAIDLDLRAVADTMVRHCARHIDGLRAAGEPTHPIPGQRTYTLWNLPRGLTVVLAGRSFVTPQALAHALGAAAAGCPVRIVALAPVAGEAWRAFDAAWADLDTPPWQVVDVAAAGPLRALLLDPALATVVLDGPADVWSIALPWCVAQPPGCRHLRAVHADGSLPGVPDWDGILKAHLHARTVAVNTMRHGAPLGGNG
ncbi:MAG: aldehyde dehydrogenase family protein [Myxococcales bacterium]|nr:aldehyde dehydrogenase family protein [Myxococcales bacterium]